MHLSNKLTCTYSEYALMHLITSVYMYPHKYIIIA